MKVDSNKEIGLGVYSNEALNVCSEAVSGSLRLAPGFIAADSDGEVKFILTSSADDTTLADIKKKIIRRIKFFSNECSLYAAAHSHAAVLKKNYEDRSKTSLCIYKILKNVSEDKLNEEFGEEFVKKIRGVRLDPITAEAIRVLQNKIEHTASKASAEIARIQNEIIRKRDEEMNAIRAQIEELKKQALQQ